jgi:site-specific DNA recombinase
MMGLVSEFVSDSIKEKAGEGQARAVAAGHFIGRAPVGYLKGSDSVLVPDPATREIVREAFERRADGASVDDIRVQLHSQGIERTVSGVRALLASRVYLGEINFGKLRRLGAHPALVDADTFKRAQRVKPSPGRKTKSDRLLARLGVLRCSSCGGRMSASSAGSRSYPFYRCASQACERPMTIGAEIAEGLVTDAVHEARADVEGRASAQQGIRRAHETLTQAEDELQAALRVLADFANEAGAIERLSELREARDEAQARVDQLGASSAAITVSPSADWGRLTLDERRALIRVTIARVLVSPGRGADRVSVELK